MTITKRPFSESPMQIIVAGIIGVVLVYVAFSLAGLKWGLILTALLGLEAFALLNKYKNDTISEVIWQFAKRPMVPWLFGLGTGWALATHWLQDPWLILAAGFLSGHFFFQAYHSNGGGE